MTKVPEPQKVQKTIVQLQAVCQQFDALNQTLDELILQADTEIQNSPLTLYRLQKDQAHHGV
jgi:prefoldin subunit 5